MAGDNRTLKKHVSILRKHLENKDSGYTIKAVYGEGYRFEETAETKANLEQNRQPQK
jgi:DNA-binding response OmpR family regulator